MYFLILRRVGKYIQQSLEAASCMYTQKTHPFIVYPGVVCESAPLAMVGCVQMSVALLCQVLTARH